MDERNREFYRISGKAHLWRAIGMQKGQMTCKVRRGRRRTGKLSQRSEEGPKISRRDGQQF